MKAYLKHPIYQMDEQGRVLLMEKHEKRLLKVVISIYSLTIFFLFLTASATYYALSHPELGLEERHPQTQAYISKYGLEGGVLRVFLIDLSKIACMLWKTTNNF